MAMNARLDAWLTRAAKSPMVAFQRFAKRLRDDYAAVKAGVTLPWSTGYIQSPAAAFQSG